MNLSRRPAASWDYWWICLHIMYIQFYFYFYLCSSSSSYLFIILFFFTTVIIVCCFIEPSYDSPIFPFCRINEGVSDFWFQNNIFNVDSLISELNYKQRTAYNPGFPYILYVEQSDKWKKHSEQLSWRATDSVITDQSVLWSEYNGAMVWS